MADERWREIADTQGKIEVSDQGRLRATKTKRPRRLKATQGIDVKVGGQNKTIRCARAVLTAFRGPAPHADSVAIHLNNDWRDNRLENLRWGTRRDVRLQSRYLSDSTNDAVLRAHAQGQSKAAIALSTGLPVTTVHGLIERHRRDYLDRVAPDGTIPGTWSWAKARMQEGRRVRRRAWQQSTTLRRRDTTYYLDIAGSEIRYPGTIAELAAMDGWELADDRF